MRLFLLFIASFIATISYGQIRHFTPYDSLPAINLLEKPAYSKDFPEWAKMLYHFPVNYNKISEAFEADQHLHPNHKSPIRRYYFLWREAVKEFVDTEGNIHLPDTNTLFNKNMSSWKGSKRAEDGIERRGQTPSNWTFLGPKETVWKISRPSGQTPGRPAPWQANVYSFDVSLSDPDILYCGTETGFVNKTTDNGKHWSLCAPDYKFSGGITAIAIDPSSPNTVYACANQQIHKSTDAGVSWTPILPFPMGINRLKIATNNPSNLIASGGKGIIISKDGGDTWTTPWNKPTWDIEFKPDNRKTLFALSSAKGEYFTLLISTDSGKTFHADPDFPRRKNKSGGLLAVTPANPNLLYVTLLTESASGDPLPAIYRGVYQPITSHFQWTLQKTGVSNNFGGFSNGQGYYDLVLAVSPDNENIVFWGTTSFWKSKDGGKQFIKIGGYGGAFGIHPDMQDIKMLPGGKMWISTDGGMNFSSDYFTDENHWSPRINGIVGSHMWGFDQGWNQDIIVGGRYHNGNTAISDTYGDKALRLGGAESPTGWILSTHPGIAVFKDINRGKTTSIPKSIDQYARSGQYLFTKQPNMKGYGKFRSNLVHHPLYSSTLYLGEGNGLWKSEDMGATWDLLHQFDKDVMFFNISHQNPNVLYLNTEKSGMWISTDGGLNWSDINNGIPSAWKKGYLHFVISPYDAKRVYLCIQKTNNSPPTKILMTQDGGKHWEDWTADLSTDIWPKVLAIQPTSEGKDLVYMISYATKNNAYRKSVVYYRQQGTNGWIPFSNGFPSNTRTLFAQPFYRDGKLRVASNAGIWETPLAEPDPTPPYLTPWVDRKHYQCMTDTIYLNDHSIINHKNITWKWSVIPQPAYLSDPSSRNPKMIADKNGSYEVTLLITKNGKSYSRTIPNFFDVSGCPPLSNRLPQDTPLEVNPIPTSGSITCTLPTEGIIAYFISDLAGNIHTQGVCTPIGHKYNIDMSGFASGVYLITFRAQGQQGIYRIKVIKQP